MRGMESVGTADLLNVLQDGKLEIAVYAQAFQLQGGSDQLRKVKPKRTRSRDPVLRTTNLSCGFRCTLIPQHVLPLEPKRTVSQKKEQGICE